MSNPAGVELSSEQNNEETLLNITNEEFKKLLNKVLYGTESFTSDTVKTSGIKVNDLSTTKGLKSLIGDGFVLLHEDLLKIIGGEVAIGGASLLNNNGAFSGIGSEVGDAAKGIGEGVGAVFSGFGEGAQAVLEGAGTFVSTAFSGAGDFADKVGSGAKKVFDGGANFVSSAFKGASTFATSISSGASKVLTGAGTFVNKAFDGASTFATSISSGASKVLTGAGTFVSDAFSGAGDFAEKGASAASSLVTGVSDGIGSLSKDLASAGAKLLAGSVEAAKELLDGVKDFHKGWLEDKTSYKDSELKRKELEAQISFMERVYEAADATEYSNNEDVKSSILNMVVGMINSYTSNIESSKESDKSDNKGILDSISDFKQDNILIKQQGIITELIEKVFSSVDTSTITITKEMTESIAQSSLNYALNYIEILTSEIDPGAPNKIQKGASKIIDAVKNSSGFMDTAKSIAGVVFLGKGDKISESISSISNRILNDILESDKVKNYKLTKKDLESANETIVNSSINIISNYISSITSSIEDDPLTLDTSKRTKLKEDSLFIFEKSLESIKNNISSKVDTTNITTSIISSFITGYSKYIDNYSLDSSYLGMSNIFIDKVTSSLEDAVVNTQINLNNKKGIIVDSIYSTSDSENLSKIVSLIEELKTILPNLKSENITVNNTSGNTPSYYDLNAGGL